MCKTRFGSQGMILCKDYDNDNCDEELFFLVWSGGFLLTCEGEMVRPYMETHTASL